MTIFKTFMKMLRANAGSLVVYFVVFVVFGTISAGANAQKTEQSFKEEKMDVLVKDEAHTELSEAVIAYIKKTENVTETKNADDRINDDVRFGIADYAICIPKDFEEQPEKIRYISAENSVSSVLMTKKLEMYLTDIEEFTGNGYNLTDAISQADRLMKEVQDTKVTLAEQKEKQGKGYFYSMFNFSAYSFMMILCISIGLIMGTLRGTDLVRRISCSSYSFQRRNAELFAAIFVMGLGMWMLFGIIALVAGAGHGDGSKFLYYMLNLLVLMLPGIAMGFLFSTLTEDRGVLNMLCNMVILGMCFISGVFVQKDLMSAEVISTSKFFPLYWFVRANELIDTNSIGHIVQGEFFTCSLIQILFAAALAGAGLTVMKIRDRA